MWEVEAFMTKEDFFQLSMEEKDNLIMSLLCKIVLFDAFMRHYSFHINVFTHEDLELIKIIIGAYLNGVLVEKEEYRKDKDVK